MSFDKAWSHYVLNTIEEPKLNQMIMDIGCQIFGYRTNNKNLKKIKSTIKIANLHRRPFIEQEVMDQLEEWHAPLFEKDEVQKYCEMTVSEFIKQIEEFKEKESKEVQLGVVNYFLKLPNILDTERDEILNYFKIDQKSDQETNNPQKAVKAPVPEPVEDAVVEDKEQMSKKDLKNLKLTKHLYEEAKQKEQQQEQRIKELTQEVERIKRMYQDQEGIHQKKLKELSDTLERSNKAYQELKAEKEALETKLKQTSLAAPYMFIGSAFIKKKVQQLKQGKYSEVNTLYIATKQWENGLAKNKHEITEVYAFFYDMEWFMRERLYEEYAGKLKIFPTDEHFHEYIEQHWED